MCVDLLFHGRNFRVVPSLGYMEATLLIKANPMTIFIWRFHCTSNRNERDLPLIFTWTQYKTNQRSILSTYEPLYCSSFMSRVVHFPVRDEPIQKGSNI